MRDHAHHVILVGDIALYEHVADALLLDAAGARVDLLLGVGGLARLAEVVDGDVSAVLREANGNRLADARRAAGHENVLALEPSHGFRGGRRGGGGWHS